MWMAVEHGKYAYLPCEYLKTGGREIVRIVHKGAATPTDRNVKFQADGLKSDWTDIKTNDPQAKRRPAKEPTAAAV